LQREIEAQRKRFFFIAVLPTSNLSTSHLQDRSKETRARNIHNFQE